MTHPVVTLMRPSKDWHKWQFTRGAASPAVDPAHLDQLARRLWAQIPTPRRAPPRAQASWRTLKPTDTLELLVPWFDSRAQRPVGERYRVLTTDSEGMSITLLTPLDRSGIVDAVRWVRPEWKTMFRRVTKRELAKGKPK